MKRVIYRMMLVTMIVLLAAMGSRAVAEDVLPDRVKGFSGQVRGVIAAKGDRNTFTLKVGSVLKVWEGNKAENPDALVDLTVRVGPRWAKGHDDRWHPVEIHVAFIKKLAVNQELTLEILHKEANRFIILELDKDQREWAASELEEDEEETEKVLPKGVRRFSGQVRGVVTSKDDKNAFTFKVARVLNVWKNNKAGNPEALVGMNVLVRPRWVQGENGKWHPLERHIAFIKRLKVDEELTLEIINDESDGFSILELSGEQREAALADIETSISEESRKDEDVQKLQTVIREMRAELRRLRAENADLRKKLDALEGKKD